MEYQTVVQKRRMVRSISAGPLPSGLVQRILANAQRGPSSGFTQGFDFLVFQGQDLEAFWAALGERPDLAGVREAPLVIVPLANSTAYVRRYQRADKAAVGRQSAEDFPAPYWWIDAAFASMLILLTAVDAGLGAFYFSLAPTSSGILPFRRKFGVPDTHHPIGAITVGYPTRDDPLRPSRAQIKSARRDPSTRVHYGRWSGAG